MLLLLEALVLCNNNSYSQECHDNLSSYYFPQNFILHEYLMKCFYFHSQMIPRIMFILVGYFCFEYLQYLTSNLCAVKDYVFTVTLPSLMFLILLIQFILAGDSLSGLWTPVLSSTASSSPSWPTVSSWAWTPIFQMETRPFSPCNW